MLKIRAVLLIFVVLGFLLPSTKMALAASPAGETLSTEELRELQAKLNSRQNLSVRFTQIRTSSLRPKKPSRSSGKALFSKPAKFRWEMEKPQADVLIFNGADLLSFKPGDKTASRFKTEGERSKEVKEVIDFVLDFDALMRRYRLVESMRLNETIHLKLKPKVAGPISDISISVDGKDYFVKTVKMIFQNKNTSEFEFSSPSSGAVDSAAFSVPPGIKIMDSI
jgi:outer membrane lipoprotein-sorting protein